MSIFQSLYKRAEEAVQNNDKLNKLINSAKEKVVKLKDDEDEIGMLIRQLNLMIRMVKAYFNGEYRSFSYKTIVMFVFSLVYFITPVDFIPDFIPGLGFTDDLSILYLVIKSFSHDIEKYQVYEDSLSEL